MNSFIGKYGTSVKIKIQAGGIATNKLNAIDAALSLRLVFCI
jgi:hypothetical protein